MVFKECKDACWRDKSQHIKWGLIHFIPYLYLYYSVYFFIVKNYFCETLGAARVRRRWIEKDLVWFAWIYGLLHSVVDFKNGLLGAVWAVFLSRVCVRRCVSSEHCEQVANYHAWSDTISCYDRLNLRKEIALPMKHYLPPFLLDIDPRPRVEWGL